MAERRSLPVLLSQVLVAFTIEFDNEVERKLAHRTTLARRAGAGKRAPYLVSLAMWAHFMQYVDDEGLTVAAFAKRTRLPRERFATWLERISKWWGYVVVDTDPNVARAQWSVRPTEAGRNAREVWAASFEVLERRWAARFGTREIAALRESLGLLVRDLGGDLPDYLPILQYGLVTALPGGVRFDGEYRDDEIATRSLVTLVSNVLLAFALEFEVESPVALALAANALRVIGDAGEKLADLPKLAGVSEEAIAMSVSFLERKGFATVGTDASPSKGKRILLTAAGRRARSEYHSIAAAIEERWQRRFGASRIAELSALLHGFFERTSDGAVRIALGLHPDPSGWRADKRYARRSAAFVHDPERALPWFPMVLHRGGWPDGS